MRPVLESMCASYRGTYACPNKNGNAIVVGYIIYIIASIAEQKINQLFKFKDRL